MAFWGHSFSFNGISCEDFGLMLYDIGEYRNGSGKFASGVTVVEDRIPSRWKPIFYGTKLDSVLEFDIIFGVNPDRVDTHKHLDRYELDAIASWLTGHRRYLWLDIEQGDMEYVRYNCIISDLKVIEYSRVPWALQAHIRCDSPFGYMTPHTFRYDLKGTTSVKLYNESSFNGYIYPVISFDHKSYDVMEITRKTEITQILSGTYPATDTETPARLEAEAVILASAYRGGELLHSVSGGVEIGEGLMTEKRSIFSVKHDVIYIDNYISVNSSPVKASIILDSDKEFSHIKARFFSSISVSDPETGETHITATYDTDYTKFQCGSNYEFPCQGDVVTVIFDRGSYIFDVIETVKTSELSIINYSDNRRMTLLTNIPNKDMNISIDNDLQIITSEDALYAPYENFNFKFLRLVPGMNELIIQGYGQLDITCQFPINTGG